jgi:hypothetical protein
MLILQLLRVMSPTGRVVGLEGRGFIPHPVDQYVCIGVPCGTNLWQASDSSQQNGAYKMAITVEKQKLLEQKAKLLMDAKIKQHDVVGLVHKAWEKSFTKKYSNKQAIVELGWNPL